MYSFHSGESIESIKGSGSKREREREKEERGEGKQMKVFAEVHKGQEVQEGARGANNTCC